MVAGSHSFGVQQGYQRTGLNNAAKMTRAKDDDFAVHIRFFKEGNPDHPGKGMVKSGYSSLRSAAAFCVGSIWKYELTDDGVFTGRLRPLPDPRAHAGKAKHAPWPLVRVTIHGGGMQVSGTAISLALHDHRKERMKRRAASKDVIARLDADLARIKPEPGPPPVDLGDDP